MCENCKFGKKYIENKNKIKMRQSIQHKLLFNRRLWIFNETFETNETLFHGCYGVCLFFHIFKRIFLVSFCLISSQIGLILSHFVSKLISVIFSVLGGQRLDM